MAAALPVMSPERGAEATRADAAEQQSAWTAVVKGAAGAAGPDAYPERYLDELRGDWPR